MLARAWEAAGRRGRVGEMLCSEQRQGGAARVWARCCGARMGEAGSQGAFKGAPVSHPVYKRT